MMTQPLRKTGVMLPLASLPSAYGVGDMGREAHRLLELLAGCGARYWQILPINPLGYGNSPYQPYSSFAGDPLYISLDLLHEDGLLQTAPGSFNSDADAVAYDDVRKYKDALLREAFTNFVPNSEYTDFLQRDWVRPYAAYMTFKRLNGMRCWNEWPEGPKNWPYHPDMELAEHEDALRYEMFLQYVFYSQWMRLKRHANGLGIEIVGDLPIYVGIDSVDVWMGRENFLLDEEGQPVFVAGVPPDYFSETGQRWGNPVYNWPHIQQDGFTFWLERLRYSAELFDVIRIDHFRGFDTYWEIPAFCPTAVEGEWKEAPGYALFDTVMEHMPGIQIIAEDLGMLRDEVYQLRDHYHFRGMKIIQFTFQPGEKLYPAQDKAHMVAYTGTHDNQTVLGWYRQMGFIRRMKSRKSLRQAGYKGGSIARRFVRLALDDAADIAIIPAADIMGLDDRARINTPGTVGPPNWMWKMKDFTDFEACLKDFAKAIAASGRGLRE